MKTLQWNMEEVFYFPSEVGVPSENGTVKVKAGFTENRTDDAVRLTGSIILLQMSILLKVNDRTSYRKKPSM
ncbi:hypothetical protein [Sporosarcina sp. ITBMC105]